MNTEHTIAMSGASGFVGSYLGKAFRNKGWGIVALGRKEFQLSPEDLAEKMGSADTVINLAGAPITGRWTEEYKKILFESRIHVTNKLVTACSLMKKKPAVFISASAVGYYASKGTHTEDQHIKADDFLGRLAQDWEQEALKAAGGGMRTVIFRFGVVLGKGGGAMDKMITPFRLGMGGTIGDGSQAFSWIHLQDLKDAYEKAIEDTSFEGIYNLTSPNPTTNKGLTEALGKALGRPTLVRVPKFVLRMQLGEGAQVLVQGQTVLPERLLDSGFTFSFPDIEEAVNDCVT